MKKRFVEPAIEIETFVIETVMINMIESGEEWTDITGMEDIE